MRSKLITVVTAVASVLLVAQVAAADQVQEQLRLMEQRMAEMEDRLQATSDELRTAKATVNEQQTLLTDSGLIEIDDSGVRSAVGSFMDSVDVSGVVAGSFNYRLLESNNRGNLVAGANSGNVGLFKYSNSNTFQVDQIWLTLDKTPTDQSRGGFHVEYVAGTAAAAQNGTLDDDEPFLYTAFVSYLAPVGNGVQIDLGKLATPLGAEVIQTNGNFNISQGLVFALQPVTHTGVSFSTQLTDELGVIVGVTNQVYSDTAVSNDNDKAYYGQLSYSGDSFGLNVGAIIGEDSVGCVGADCQTSVVDVVLTADPLENLSVWANFDWVHSTGESIPADDAFGYAVAGRLALTDTMGVATRVEYVTIDGGLNGTTRDSETFSLTGTVDKTLAEGLVGKLELRWDTQLDDNDNADVFATSDNGFRNDQLVALAQMYYEF
ncbi:MAG: carbohydrate porin [bacterium]|nr:carbohydrate porin [bacterium]